MPKTIKTREVTRDVKTLDRQTVLNDALRTVQTKTKEAAGQADGSERDGYRDGGDYAVAQVERAASDGATAAKDAATRGVGNVRDKLRDVRSIRDGLKDSGQTVRGTRQTGSAARGQTTQTIPGQGAQTSAAKAATNRQDAARQAVAGGRQAASRQAAARSTAAASRGAAKDAAAKAAATNRQTDAAAKGSIKYGSKGTVKTATHSIKGTQRTVSRAAKTTQRTAHGAKATARGAQIAARNAAAAARTASRVSVTLARAVAKGVAALGKAAIAATKSLISVIAAGGWVAVVVIFIICLIGLIAGSAFGIFFAGEDTRDGNPSLREVIAVINQEHQDEIEQIKADSPHDEVMVSGTKAPWREVLAVYAVKTTTDAANQQDAITLDARRQQILKDVYWDMNSIESRTEGREYTEIIAVEQPDGSIIEETETYTRRTFYITQSAKTAEQMADEYSFNAEQRELLAELLAPEYASAWQSVLYGIRTGSGDIVEVAASQLGNPGGQPYWSWYGFSSRVEWCACFVSWCANESGYIEAGIIPKFSHCQTGINWFADAGCWQDADSGYEPRPGDIIFFDWGDGGDSDHVGIVESCDGSIVRTIEGNSGDAVNRRSYRLSSTYIVGYGCPEY